jgi:cytochrome d ubiquinol oxidase subunit I
MNRKLQVLLGAVAVLAITAGTASLLSHESTEADLASVAVEQQPSAPAPADAPAAPAPAQGAPAAATPGTTATPATPAAADQKDKPYEEVAYRQFPVVGSRVAIWMVAQLHLLFAAFVLAVPIFALIVEAIGYKTGDLRYDRLAYEFTKLLSVSFSLTATFGAFLTFMLIALYPKFTNYLMSVFSPTFLPYVLLFFFEAFFLYTWARRSCSSPTRGSRS